MQKTPEQFVHDVLAGGLGIRHAVVGYDFRFGNRRAGDVATLAGARPGVRLRRDADRAGRLARRGLLVEPDPRGGRRRRRGARARPAGPSLPGRGPGGQGRPSRPRARLSDRQPDRRASAVCGRPTASTRCAPPGVAPRAHPGSDAVASLGLRPTFDGRDRRLEVHLLDREVDLYGRRLCCAFVERLRGEETVRHASRSSRRRWRRTAPRPARRSPTARPQDRRRSLTLPRAIPILCRHEHAAPDEANYPPGPPQGPGRGRLSPLPSGARS